MIFVTTDGLFLSSLKVDMNSLVFTPSILKPRISLLAAILLLSSTAQTARADCDYDDEWCCDPRTWCEALHFGFYLFLASLMLSAGAVSVYDRHLQERLARDIVRQGTTTSAKVLAVQAKRLNTEDAPFAIMEYAALVQFTPPASFPSDIVIKWVKIKEAQYKQLAASLSSTGSSGGAVQHLPTILRHFEAHPQVISEETLQSLREANARAMAEMQVHTLPEYPKSAVCGDPTASGFNICQKIVYATILLLCTGSCIFLVLWFASTYEYNFFQAGAKIVVIVASVMLAVWGALWIHKVFDRPSAERDFILTDEVRTGSPTVELAPEESTRLVSRIIAV